MTSHLYEYRGVFYNLRHVVAVRDISGRVRPFYFHRKYQPPKKGWFFTIPAVEEGFYKDILFEGMKGPVPKEEAIFPEGTAKVWLANSDSPAIWYLGTQDKIKWLKRLIEVANNE